MRSCLRHPFLLGAFSLIAAAATAADAPPERWINASEVNLRSEPGARGAVLALLPLGATVQWIGGSERNGFCEIDSAGTRGFVPCRFLSASAPSAPTGGAAAADTTGTRWVVGAGVNLRADPSPQSVVIARLALNARVELLATIADSPYCEVATGAPGSARGYTACRYLATAPLATERIVTATLADGHPNPQYDPARAFWLAPSWARLEAYGTQLGLSLKERIGTPAEQSAPELRPVDPEFERMKAHLAQGVYAPAPAPLARWDDVMRLARVVAAPTPTSGVAAATRERAELVRDNARVRLAGILTLWSPPFDALDGSSAERLADLVNALELPAVRPSLFRTASDLAPPGASIEDLSGRFHIVETYRARGRDLGAALGTVDGVWDIGQVTASLTQPVVRTTLFRDGRLHADVVRPSDTRVLWGAMEAPMCDGYLDGFAYGDADARIWRYFGADFQPDAALRGRPAAGTLLSISTRNALPATAAPPVVTTNALDRQRTGFVRGTWMHFDLDGDGVVDLAVWEGTGKGPGHLDGVTKTDDPYYRLFFANIEGRWHVLGTDVFSYGCGC